MRAREAMANPDRLPRPCRPRPSPGLVFDDEDHLSCSATISPQAVFRFSKKGTLCFDEAPNASRFTFLLSRVINPPVADCLPGVRPHGECAGYRPVPWSRPKVERHVELDDRALRLV
jgi:hypothetical protein